MMYFDVGLIEKLKILISEEGDYFKWNNIFECYIQRNTLQSWCGYIKIPLNIYNSIDSKFDCHGGITYNEKLKDYHIIGFDTSLCDDLSPALLFIHYNLYLLTPRLGSQFPGSNSQLVYRNKEYVISQTNYIVEQIINKLNQKRIEKINSIIQ